MEFTATDKDRSKTKKKRRRYDKNFKVFKVIQYISMLVFVPSLIWLCTDGQIDDLVFLGSTSLVSVSGILAFAMWVLVWSMTGTHVTDMFEERLEIKDDNLIHSYNMALGGGQMSSIEGGIRKFHIIPLNRIKSCIADKKTGRLEIVADVQIILTNRGQFQSQEEETDMKLVMYDYYTPSLIAELKKRNLVTEMDKIEYKLNECPDKYKGWEGHKRFQEDIENGRVTRI